MFYACLYASACAAVSINGHLSFKTLKVDGISGLQSVHKDVREESEPAQFSVVVGDRAGAAPSVSLPLLPPPAQQSG